MPLVSRMLGGLFLLLCLAAFSQQKPPASAQPSEERQAQEELPKSSDPMWAILKKTKIRYNEKTGDYSASYPPEIKALVGKEVTMSGFILPLEQTEKFKHFILSKRTPTCPFCPPGEPNEIIDITLDKPIGWADEQVKVKGTFALINNPQLGMFFALKPAARVK